VTPLWFRKAGAFVVVVVAHVGAVESAAQTAPRTRPFSFSLAMSSGFEDAAATTRSSQVRRPAAPSRIYGEVGYTARTRRSLFALSGATTVTHQPQFSRFAAVGYAGAANWNVTLGRRTSFEMKQRFSLAPLELFNSVGSGTETGGFSVLTSDNALPSRQMLTYDGSFDLRRTLSRRSSMALSLTSSLSSVRSENATRNEVRAGLVTGRVERRLGAAASLYAGYGFGLTDLSNPAVGSSTAERHDISAGIDYARRLPFATDTTFKFVAGSTVLAMSTGRAVRITTIAALERPFARLWSGRLEYSRPVEYVAGFTEPLLSDAIRLDVRGRLSGRVWTTMQTAYSQGSIGLDGADFANYFVTGRVGLQIRPHLRLDVDGYWSSYRFNSASPLPSFVPELVRRRGVRAGLAWSSSPPQR
jgi:opacity protein-like surface antigen